MVEAATGKLSKTKKSVLELDHKAARRFFLKAESYCGVDLPEYVQFGPLLASVASALGTNSINGVSAKPFEHEGVNHLMLTNKDGRHAWRPFQLINPLLYVSLVREITDEANWSSILLRFKQFANLRRFKCLSIPVMSTSRRKDKAEQILQWWHGIEQRSINLALDFSHLMQADISDCYSSIYTHSIAWSIHGRDHAKGNKNDKTLIGNFIDKQIQNMQHGQTNGIPQGSVLMDFIAELILGYADELLEQRLERTGNQDYRILRYRDDYRIFVNNPQFGEVILKNLTEVLYSLGLKLNSKKTTGAQCIIAAALKPDKIAFLRLKSEHTDLRKQLLVIHSHGMEYINSGSLAVALSMFHKTLLGKKHIRDPITLASIATDIACTSPRAFPICAAIISKLLNAIPTKQTRVKLIKKIHAKLSQLPNVGHMEVWLQRVSFAHCPKICFNEPLCKIIAGSEASIWNNQWVTCAKLKRALNRSIINRKRLKQTRPIVHPREIDIFWYE